MLGAGGGTVSSSPEDEAFDKRGNRLLRVEVMEHAPSVIELKSRRKSIAPLTVRLSQVHT